MMIPPLLLLPAANCPTPAQAKAAPMTLQFHTLTFHHRWSKADQHEFTPAGQEDLTQWKDMLTVNVHPKVHDGESLADLANVVLGRYQEHGRILRTDSVPRTEQRPAEHLAVAVLGSPQLMEAVFARFVLVEGTGCVITLSHRCQGPKASDEMSRWLSTQGQETEQTLMTWSPLPTPTRLGTLPRSN